MKTKPQSLLVLLAWFAALNSIHAQGTAFTYQGRLNQEGATVDGTYDLSFTLYATNQPGGIAVAGPVTNAAVVVANGLFTTLVDFGGAFAGSTNWLELAVSTNGANSFTILAPRQQLTPTPYALFAETARNVVGTLSTGGLAGEYGGAVTLDNASNAFSGTFTGDGSNLSGVSANSLNGLTSAGFWQLGGNAGASPTNGAFLGTSDTMPLEFWVNTNRALRLEYAYDSHRGSASPNVVGGFAGNVVSNGFVGGFIAGGGTTNFPNLVGANYASVLGGDGNRAIADYATVMGVGNTAGGFTSTAMGSGTTAGGAFATAMGYSTTAGGANSTAMGYGTIAVGDYSTANGYKTAALGDYSSANGNSTTAGAIYSTATGLSTDARGEGATAMGAYTHSWGHTSLAMGTHTSAEGDYAFAGGYFASAAYDGSFVWADNSSSNYFEDSKANQFLIRASGGVGIGTANTPAGGLNVAGGGLAVTGASSPRYPGAQGAFIEGQNTYGSIYAFDYVNNHTLPLYLNAPGGYVGIGTTSPDSALTVNGSADKPGGGSWSTYSDARLKNVGDHFTPGLAALEKIQPVYYHYKSDNALKLPSQPEFIGVVAQELQQAVPDAVQTNGSGFLTVNNDPVLWATVNAVNQLNQKLERENAQLQSRLERLEKLLASQLAEK